MLKNEVISFSKGTSYLVYPVKGSMLDFLRPQEKHYWDVQDDLANNFY